MLAELVSSEGFEGKCVPGLSVWLVDGPLLPVSLHCLSSMCACLYPNFPFYKDSSHIELEPTLVTSF